MDDEWLEEDPAELEARLEAESSPAYLEMLEQLWAEQEAFDARAFALDISDGPDLWLALDELNDGWVVADCRDTVLLAGLRAAQRAQAALAAQQLVLVSELTARRTGAVQADAAAGRVPSSTVELFLRAVADEITLETGLTRYAATKLQDTAMQLERFPKTFDALADGRLSARKAEVIADGLCNVQSESVRAHLEEKAIGVADGSLLPDGKPRPPLMPAPVTGVNVPKLRDFLKAWTAAAELEVAKDRATKAKAERRVVFTPLEDDMAEILAILPADDAARIRALVEHAADQSKSDGDARTADQRRADAFVDLLTCEPWLFETVAEVAEVADPAPAGDAATGDAAADTAPGDRSDRRPWGRPDQRLRPPGWKYRINVTLPLEVLTGDSDQPGYLDRYGPVTADLARRFAADAVKDGTFACSIVDGVHGTLLGLGTSTVTTRYVASEALKRHVATRDRCCRFPGCRAAAVRCDFDHRTPYAEGGTTCECNGESGRLLESARCARTIIG